MFSVLFFVALLSTCVALNTTLSDPNYVGIWWWTWSGSTSIAPGTNIGIVLWTKFKSWYLICGFRITGIAFSGWADPWTAIQTSEAIHWKLPGTKYISLGGGNANGRFSQGTLDSITNAAYNGAFSGYDGVVFDIEEGDSGLSGAFQNAFQAVKSKGMKVLVTVSHSAPYGIGDSADLMRSFFWNSNIDILSPQLYTSGEEWSNDFTTTAGVNWSEYANAKAAVVPSIVRSSLYWDAQGYFQSQGVSIQGYVQWSQSG